MTGSVDADHYARLFEAFEHVRTLRAEERLVFLERLRVERPELAVELQRLVDADGDQRGDVFDAGAIDGRGPLNVPRGSAEPGDVDLPRSIGPFRILGLLGRGGMGVVYEAEQDEPRRRVALKLVHAGLASGERVQRFRREAEVMARLQHPGIAQIHATGSVDLGTGEQPYLVMEVVQGASLLAHAERHALSRTRRLELVVRLCDAVQHAHDRGVVHRDLKPDNILVDERGQPKVLDFGVARLTDPDTAQITLQTQQGAIIGTLTHMAPEQLSADPGSVGPAADIYALGVIAFQLLTGRLPHNVAGLPLDQVARRLLEHDAPRLGSVERTLRGDLETIVGKALESDPERRYASAEALGADLRRHLAHEPISARAPSAIYRAGRFARRHRGLVAGTTAAMLALAVGVVVAATYAIEAREGRREAESASYRHVLSAVEARLDRPASDTERALLHEAPEAPRGWEWEHLHARTADPSRVLCEGRPGGVAIGMLDGRPAVAVSRFFPDEDAIEVHDLEDGTLVARWATGMPVVAMAWTPAGQLTWVTEDPLPEGRARRVRVVRRHPSRSAGDLERNLGPAFPGGSSLSSDGSTLVRLVPGDEGVRAVLHDIDEGTSLAIDVDPGAGSPSIDPEGRLVALKTNRGLLVVDAASGAERLCLVRCEGRFDPTSGLLVVMDRDQQLRVWDVQAQPPCVVHAMSRSVRLSSVSATSARDSLALVDMSGLLTRVDLGTAPLLADLGRTLVPESRAGIGWSPDGRHLVTTSSRDVRVWDARAVDGGVLVRHASFVYALDCRADLGLLVSAGWDGWVGEPGCLRVSDRSTGAQRWRLGEAGSIARAAAFCADPDLLLVGLDNPADKVLLGLDPVTGVERWRRPGLNVRDLAVAPRAAGVPARVAVYEGTGGLAVLATEDGRDLWRGRSGAGPDAEWEHALAWSPDGRRLAVTAGVQSLELRDPHDGAVIGSWEASGLPGARVYAVAFSPDSAVLASACEDRTVAFWDGRTGADLGIRLEHDGHVLSLAWHPSGTRLVSGGRDGALHVWSVPDGRELLRLEGHSGYVKDLCWTDGGRTLLSASGDGTVRRWESLPAGR